MYFDAFKTSSTGKRDIKLSMRKNQACSPNPVYPVIPGFTFGKRIAAMPVNAVLYTKIPRARKNLFNTLNIFN
jgi:hypothetical protein